MRGPFCVSGVVDDGSTDETSLALLLSTAKVPSSGVDVAYELGGADIIVDILDASLDIWELRSLSKFPATKLRPK